MFGRLSLFIDVFEKRGEICLVEPSTMRCELCCEALGYRVTGLPSDLDVNTSH